MAQRILVVDDDTRARDVLVRFVERLGYETQCVGNGKDALDAVIARHPDLILLDVEMPVLGGIDVCRILKADPRTALIPITMLTGMTDADARLLGIEAGADDFLPKPVDFALLQARIRSQLRLKRITDQLESTEAVVFTMARWVEMKDQYTEGHLRRVAGYSELLAAAYGLEEDDRQGVRFAGILHDIGKIGVSDLILTKPGPLTPQEREQLERHPVFGAEIIAPMRFSGSVGPIVLAHHERWDGQGYPGKLAGNHIPIGARFLAVVDAWDAMTTDRPYRGSLGTQEALRRLREGAGSQWDPEVVSLFVALLDEGALNPSASLEIDREAA
jgi:putative two-component system response regulator